MAKRIHDILKTKANKIRRAKKELSKNPNNTNVKNSLEYWEHNNSKPKRKKNG